MLSVWDPFTDFRVSSSPSVDWKPSVDVHEDTDALYLTAEIPGVPSDSITVGIDNNMLTLSGERKRDQTIKRGQYHRVERRYGCFKRQFILTDDLDTEAVSAKYNAGLLEVTIPKKPAAKPKQIQIQME